MHEWLTDHLTQGVCTVRKEIKGTTLLGNYRSRD